MAALRAAGWRGRRPHPAGSRVARWTIAPPASLPAELPHRPTYPTSAPLTAARRREWRVDEQTSNANPVTSARGRDPTRWGGSRARTPGSRVPHRAQGLGGRMPPMLRNPLRPGGPRNTHPATIRISIHAAGTMPASTGVSGILVQAAGRGVDAQSERGQRCHPREGVGHARTKGAGQDARLHSMFIMPVD